MSIVKVFGKLRRSKLFLTFVALLVLHFSFSSLFKKPDAVSVVSQQNVSNGANADNNNNAQSQIDQNPGSFSPDGIYQGESSNPNNNLKALDDTETESIFKEPEVPTLINFDLHDVTNFLKSFFQDQEKVLREKLRSYAKYVKNTQQSSEIATINKHSEIEIDNFNYEDYSVEVPDIYVSKFKDPDEQLPIVNNYDIRFTLSVYFNYIKHKLDDLNNNENKDSPSFDIDLPFHWYDWVDITALNKYIIFHNDPYIPKEDKERYNCEYISTNLVRNFGDHGEDLPDDKNRKKPHEIRYNPKTFCRNLDQITDLTPDYEQNKNSSINFNVFKWTRKSSIRAKMLQSRSYLYAGAPTPISIIFLVDQNFDLEAEKNKKVSNLKAKRAMVENIDEIQDVNKDKRVNNIIAYEFPIKGGGTVGHGKKLLENYEAIVKLYMEQEKGKLAVTNDLRVNPLDDLQRLVQSYPPTKFPEDPDENDHEIYLDNEELLVKLSTKEFEYDHNQAILDYEEKFQQLRGELQKQQQEEMKKDVKLELKYKKEIAHYDSLKYSKRVKPAEVKKHFHEVPIAPSAGDDSGDKLKKAGGHYDWRFFNGIIESETETRRTLHHLLRSFLKFTYAKNVPTWIAHGSLLSWYWNGLNFPWDYDIDVQMPIKDLQKFCKLYNNTLVVQNLNDGLGKYFIDCGSSLTHRTKEYGKNNIDARFIDVDKGIYIDITGLALTEAPLPKKLMNLRKRDLHDLDSVDNSTTIIRNKGTKYPFTVVNEDTEETEKQLKKRDADPAVIKPQQITPARIVKTYKDGLTPEERLSKNARLQIYNCKNNHFVFYSQISPLRLTIVEGTKGFVPFNYKQVLKDEYHSSALSGQYFAKHFYLRKLRLWVHASKFKSFFKKLIKEEGNGHYRKSLSKNLHAIDNDISDLSRFLEYDETVLKAYYLNQRITKEHEREMEALSNGDSVKEVLLSNIEFKPILKDHFLHMKNDVARNKNGAIAGVDGAATDDNNEQDMYDSVKGTLEMDEMTGDDEEGSLNDGKFINDGSVSSGSGSGGVAVNVAGSGENEAVNAGEGPVSKPEAAAEEAEKVAEAEVAEDTLAKQEAEQEEDKK